MRRAFSVTIVAVLVMGAVAVTGCNPGSALGLHDWGRDLLTIPAAVIIGELIDEAQGTNVPVDREGLHDELYNELLNDLQSEQVLPETQIPEPGPAGPAGADGQDGVDGRDGQDGADGRDGVDGQDGQDGKDGKDLYAVAMGCIDNEGTPLRGYGFNATRVEGFSGVYAVALVGYEFPENFNPNDLTILVTPNAIVSQEIVPSYEAGVGFGFLVEFRDVWFNRVDTGFCFAVYDTSTDPYGTMAATGDGQEPGE